MDTGSPQHLMATRSEMLRHVTDQPGLAHTSLTVDQHGCGHPHSRRGQDLAEKPLLGDPSGERAGPGTRGVAHRQSVTPALAPVIRDKDRDVRD